MIFYGKEKDYSQYEEMKKQIFDMQKKAMYLHDCFQVPTEIRAKYKGMLRQ